MLKIAISLRIWKAIKRRFFKKYIRLKYAILPSYRKIGFGSIELSNYFKPPSIPILMKNKEMILDVAGLYCDHCFDLLGSGWVNVRHGMNVFGFEGNIYKSEFPVYDFNRSKFIKKIINQANFSTSLKIFNLIDENYIPIDWHIDFKSGYRWDQKQWYKNIKYGHLPGVDIKVPWELSRMQHLPFLAYAYIIESPGIKAEKYLGEFKNQVLDFIAQNPPNYGVNWKCPMDVGIRVSNWLLTYDLFVGSGVRFDHSFNEIFISNIHSHGKFITTNFEWGEVRNNHYLANIAGLLFAAAYLAPSDETELWLAFALQELIVELFFQFHEDGSNFEASTSYHRLSLEIMAYCSILGILIKDKHKDKLPSGSKIFHRANKSNFPIKDQYGATHRFFFPDSYWERIYKAANFTKAIVKGDGLIAQIGDNDSGRFFKLWPTYEKLDYSSLKKKYLNLTEYSGIKNRTHYYNEVVLNHTHIVDVLDHIFTGIVNESPEISVVQNSISNFTVNFSVDSVHPEENGRLNFWINKLTSEFGKPIEYKFEIKEGTKNIQIHRFPDFGLYILKNEDFFLSFKCGAVGTKGLGGHDHNDQLSLILTVGKENILVDPGTYVYTSSPDKRNLYRSTFQHFTLIKHGQEQNDLSSKVEGLFSIDDRTQSKCIYFGKDGFVGFHSGFGEKVFRIGHITENQINIYDFGKNIIYMENANVPFSDAYGRLISCKQTMHHYKNTP